MQELTKHEVKAKTEKLTDSYSLLLEKITEEANSPVNTTARMMQMVDERNEELDQSLNKEELEKKINFEEAQVSAN